jgi:hypothetical protein
VIGFQGAHPLKFAALFVALDSMRGSKFEESGEEPVVKRDGSPAQFVESQANPLDKSIIGVPCIAHRLSF